MVALNEGIKSNLNQSTLVARTMSQLMKVQHRMNGKQIFGGILDSEPEAMLAWMSEVQPGEIPGAVKKWADLDLEGATTWLAAQEPSPVRDQAIAKFAREASELDAEAAADWAREIADERLREETLRRVESR